MIVNIGISAADFKAKGQDDGRFFWVHPVIPRPADPGRPDRLGMLVRPRYRQRHQTARRLRQKAPSLPTGHRRPCQMVAPHQPARRLQQRDQGHQANGPRIPRRPILLPQNPNRLLRNHRM